MKVRSEERATYAVTPAQETSDDRAIEYALEILLKRLVVKGDSMASPASVRSFLQLKMTALEHEVFAVMYLDAQNRMIAYEELFRGTLTQTSVYPREVVKLALARNCAAVILAHNHPSGLAEPSRADEMITTSLKAALALVDVKVLDHFIVVGASTPLSFAERGLI